MTNARHYWPHFAAMALAGSLVLTACQAGTNQTASDRRGETRPTGAVEMDLCVVGGLPEGTAPPVEFGAQVATAMQRYVSFRPELQGSGMAMHSSQDEQTIREAAAGGCDVLLAVGPEAGQGALKLASEFRQVVLIDRDVDAPKERPDNVAMVSVAFADAFRVAGHHLSPAVAEDGGATHTVLALDESVDWQRDIANQLTKAMPQNPGAPTPVRLDLAGMKQKEVQAAVTRQLAPAPDHTFVVVIDQTSALWVVDTVAGFEGSASAAGAGVDLRLDYWNLEGRIALSVGADMLSALTQVLDAAATGGKVPDVKVAAAVYDGSYKDVTGSG